MKRLAVLLLIPCALPAAAQSVGYNRDVRPILSENCFFCHGPDKAKQKADLRLDTEAGAFAALKSDAGHAIVPGKPAESQLWQRINSTDPEEVMPPPVAKLALTAEEKDVLRRWIAQGAKYEAHWAYVPLPATVPVPEISPIGPISPIDAFIRARLAEEKLPPSPPADPLRWLRRATLDLTGLPPTPEQIGAFEKDVAAHPQTAFETAADALLASRAFGETMAVPWLDAARYADTTGYHGDVTFNFWPYRDWVAQAFNDDLPYDQFLTWNLAGDLLPNATREQQTATMFNRLHRITNEGGSVWEEFRVDGIADRVHTVGTALLGLTMECARCHDHKYDPITQKDYYSLFAFFNSINETGVFNHEAITPPPTLLLPTLEQEQALAARRTEVVELEKKLAAAQAEATPRFDAWFAGPARTLTMSDASGHFTFDETGEPLRNRGTFMLPPAAPKKDEKPKEQKPRPLVAKLDSPKYVPGRHDTAVLLDGDRGVIFPGYFLKDRWEAFTQAMWLRDSLREKQPVTVTSRCFGHDVGRNGIHLELEDGRLHARVYRSWPDNGLGVRSVAQLPQGEWAHVVFTYDGSSHAEGLRLFLNGQPLAVTVTGSRVEKAVATKTIRDGEFILGAIFRGAGFKGGEVDDLRLFDRAITPLEVRELAGGQAMATGSRAELREFYLSSVDAECRTRFARLTEARQAMVAAEDAILEVPVMRELPEPRPAHLLARGAYDAPKTDANLVQRDTIAALTPFPKDAPRNRLGLAQWLTAPDHPLTARVLVNRVWQQFFGRGFVGTTENFGLQGELPSHPELLDWLARDFISSGWKVKRLCRQIVLSATYRQQSAATPALLERDPDNRLLARGPSHRLSAETIRDLALAASGLLTGKHDGPPVRPYDPLNNTKPDPKQVHARSLYSFWRRTKPMPNMIALDRPTREVCVVRRSQTNSPAQALVLLNDVQFVEAARVLATEVLRREADDTQRLRSAWLRLTGSHPLADELKLLHKLLTTQRAEFSAAPERAELLISIGLTSVPKDTNHMEIAAFTVVCQAILNSDAALWKR